MRHMVASVRSRLLMIALAAAVLGVGCGQSALQSPTGPSLGSSVGEGDLLAKKGNGRGGGAPEGDEFENENGQQPNQGDGPGRSHQVHVVGFVTANDGTALIVNEITIVPGLDAVIRHGNRELTLADIEEGDHVHARGVMEDTTLVAEEIKVQDTGNDNEGGTEGATELRGAISGLSAVAGCPVVTFMIGTTKVTTSAATTFDDGTCAALLDGKIVEVEGTTGADGILATKVEFEDGPDQVTGKVFEFSGAAGCAAATATFKVGPVLSLAKLVTLTLAPPTTFTGVTCATLVNGMSVEVEGTIQPDSSITAASVELH